MISVIIPVYNTEKYLMRCLESVARQTYKDFECIVVDDGSDDSSLTLAKSIESKDKRFRVYTKKNGGVSSARNYGIEKARGEYLYFMDSDDELFDDTLSVLINKMTDGVDLVIGGMVWYDEKGDVIYSTKGDVEMTTTPKEAMDIVASPSKYYRTMGMPWMNLFKRTIIMESFLRFGEHLSILEDLPFLVSYICKCKGSISFTTIPIYKYYCIRPGSLMTERYRTFRINSLDELYGRIEVLEQARHFGQSRKMVNQSKIAVYAKYKELILYVKQYGHKEKCKELKKLLVSCLTPQDLFVLKCRDVIKTIYNASSIGGWID